MTLRTGNAVDLNTNSLILPLASIDIIFTTYTTNSHSISQSHLPLIPSLSSSISRIAPHLTQKRESFLSLSGSSPDRSLLHVSWRDRPTCIQTTKTRVASSSIINAWAPHHHPHSSLSTDGPPINILASGLLSHIQYRDPAHDSMSCHVTQVEWVNNMTWVAQACGVRLRVLNTQWWYVTLTSLT